MSTDRPRPIIVDDIDPDIVYTGPWFQDQGSQNSAGNFGPVFQDTLHGTKSDASLSYAFNGSRVVVFGSNSLRNDSGVLDPSWECFVDKISIGASKPFPFDENNWVFCQQDTLVDGPHVLTVNVTVAKAQTFWFDQIQYVPSASVALDQQIILVDSLDPELQYGPGWQALGGTANMTSVQNAQFEFHFTGIQLSWYGFIPQEFPHGPSPATYSIDGQTPINFLLKGLPQVSGSIYNQEFFSTQALSPGPHKLVVVHEGTGSTTPLTLDYIVVQNGTIPATNTTSNPNNGTTAPASNTTSGTKSKTPVGAIAGGVIGGLVLILLAVIGFLFLRRRDKRRLSRESASSFDPGHTVEPFNAGVQTGPSLQALQTAQVGSGYSSRGYIHHGSMPSSSNTDFTSIVAPSSGTTGHPQPLQPNRLPSSSNTSEFNPYVPHEPLVPPKVQREREAAEAALRLHRPPAGPRPFSAQSDDTPSSLMLHEDSGVRISPDGQRVNRVLEVPPLYTPG
ncbi:hypothetical protein B0H34DRAFT_781303 [Crassisporium funariophilum]|nr:hypothetical protein B0H34DRAFT_781303 [Crassisporium funariophilum]